jgi:hypothetical protein
LAGLDPAIHVFRSALVLEDVDLRVKPGEARILGASV